jgi:large subunit ribosomal protein L26e
LVGAALGSGIYFAAPLQMVVHIARLSSSLMLLFLFSGATVSVGIDPSKVVITKLKMDKDRRALLERRGAAKAAEKNKGKYGEGEVQAMAEVD